MKRTKAAAPKSSGAGPRAARPGQSANHRGRPGAPLKPPASVARPKTVRGSRRRVDSGISLADLISAGLITPPLAIFKIYRGRRFTARIALDGSIVFRGKSYESLSAAAGTARKELIDTPRGFDYPPTNGWTFWRFVDSSGRTRTLASLRMRLSPPAPRPGQR